MQKTRPKAVLIRDLMNAANLPFKAKGGFGSQHRAAQRLMREAALTLGKWGSISKSRRRQPVDLLGPSSGAFLPLAQSNREVA